jgi:hypothetical protein
MLNSIRDLDRADAVALFGDAVEGASYLEACEKTEVGSELGTGLIAVYKGTSVVAAAPVFQMEYRLDMALPKRFRAIGDSLYKIAPRLVSMPALGLGTRTSEECPLGFAPSLTPAERDATFARLLEGLSHHASQVGIKLLGVKCFTDQDARWGHGLLDAAGFTRSPIPPSAVLHLPFADEAGYLASLSKKMRKDLKHKMKNFANVEVDIRHSFDGIEDECIDMLEETEKRSKIDYGAFSNVPHSYLREAATALGDQAFIATFRVEGKLAGFCLSMIDGDRLVAKYLGMRYPLAREYDIYFLNWMTWVRYCLQHRIPWLHLGITCYHQKVRLGCKLKRCWIYFKHTGPILGPVLRWILPRRPFDATDPDLAALGEKAPYLPPDVATGTLLRPVT